MSSVLDDLIQAELQGQSQGSEVTAAAVVTAIGQMTPSQKSQVLTALGVDPASTKVTDLESTSITLALAADNTIYEYGELSALTVTSIENPADFIIRFTSGATATTTNFPASMVFPEVFAAEANTRYEINCSNGYALVTGWPTT